MSMRSSVVLAAVAVLFSASFLRAEGEDKTFADQQKAFSFKYPADWKIDSQKAGSNVSITYASKDASIASNLQINLLTLPQAGDDNDLQAKIAESTITGLKKRIEQFKLIKSENFDFQKGGAQRIHFSGTQNGLPLRFIQIIAVRQTQVVLITCTTTEKAFADEQPKFDKMVGSFELGAAK